MTTVELCLGSGLNPSWQLEPSRESRLVGLLANLPPVAEVAAAAASLSMRAVRQGRSGYQGMILRSDDDGSPFREPVLIAWDEFGDRFVATDGNLQLERFLFDTAPQEIKDSLGLDFETLAVRTGQLFQISGLSGPRGPGIRCATSPPFEPERWFQHRLNNNCYSYALNRLMDRFPPPIPGREARNDWTCAILTDLVQLDGLQLLHPSVEPDQCPTQGHVVAICQDHRANGIAIFHCLRRDSSGFWSHKMSTAGTVTHLDDDGKMMPTLQGAKFLTEMSICGFFATPG